MSKIDFETITRTCCACPSQWEGKLTDGKRMFYARFRHGHFYVEFSNEPADNVMDFDHTQATIMHEFDHPTKDGFMANWEFYRILQKKNLLHTNFLTGIAIKYFGWFFQKLEERKEAHSWRKAFARIEKHGFFGEKDNES